MFWIALILAVFPQTKVDRICLENRERKVVLDKQTSLNTKIEQKHTAQKILSLEEYGKNIPMSREFLTEESFFLGKERSQYIESLLNKKGVLSIGPGPDTFLVNTDYVQDGDIIISGDGVLLVDNAKLTLSGIMYAQNRGQAILKNGAYLHVEQQYLSQYPQFFYDSSRFEAVECTVYANTVYRTFLHNNSEYIAKRTYFPFWNFRQVYDNATLIMEDAGMVGDLTINDSCQISFLRCDTILPWFGVGEGDFMDVQFPDYKVVNHFQFDTTHSGVRGIKYSATFDTCNMVLWGIESWPGCSVTVRNSVVSATPRISGSDTIYFNNISNQTFYPSLILPFNDRSFQLINTYVQIWCIYTYDKVVLYMDSCFWGETHAKDSSAIYAVSCSTNGFPSSVTSTEDGFFSFIDGKVTAIVSSWNRATTYLENTIVTPIRPGIAQITNIAHHHSYILCVNCEFDTLPFAIDTALVMFTAIDSPTTGMIDTTIDIYGSAWIDAGPFNPITFDRYKLYWTPEGDSIWTLIEDSTIQVHNDVISAWNTSGMSIGEYDLRLTIWDDAGDSLTAFGNITLEGVGTEEKNVRNRHAYSLHTHQKNSELQISFSAPVNKQITLDIFDIAGRKVKTLFKGKVENSIDLTYEPIPGIYFIRLSGEKTITKKVVFVK